MFDRFTDPARKIMGYARQHALRLGHNWIGGVHVLLALLEEQQGLAGRALRDQGLTLDYATQAVQALTPPDGPVDAGAQLPFSSDAKALLEGAEAVADAGQIDSEHLLLGLVADPECAASRVLVALGADPEQVKQAVYGLVASQPARTASSSAKAGSLSADGLAVVGCTAITNLRGARDLIQVLLRANPDLQRAADLVQQALDELERQLPA